MSLFAFSPGYRVLVVGGTGGIGAAIARALLEEGCEVIVTGVNEAAVRAAAIAPQARLQLRALDVTDDGEVECFVQPLGRLDALVNCAGILARDREYDLPTFQRVLDVNLTGTFRLCSRCRPLLAANGERGGAIVNVASMNAFVALPRIPAYCASKGGVVMLTRSLALAWAPEGIRVNALAPGYVETPLNAEGRAERPHYERIRARIALGRWAQPEDIAGSALFLLSPAARYVTGSVLAVDGGFLAG